MFQRIFPKQIDNVYRGHWIGLWLLIPILLSRLAMGANAMINTRFVLAGADGIPLDHYDAGAAETVVALFAIGGFFLLLFGVLGVVALIRYRAMIPFVYGLLLLQQIGNWVLGHMHHIARSGVPSAKLGFAFIIAVLAATLVGFVLSLLPSAPQKAVPA